MRGSLPPENIFSGGVLPLTLVPVPPGRRNPPVRDLASGSGWRGKDEVRPRRYGGISPGVLGRRGALFREILNRTPGTHLHGRENLRQSISFSDKKYFPGKATAAMRRDE
ncbi:MAG: hypothetical protein C6W57_07815 [Caldibacillus debilis]|nr:MAG: hypothetical protein C6W57_07815 [Caldibacillus debilis]